VLVHNPVERSPVIRSRILRILRFWTQLHSWLLNKDPVAQTKGSIQTFSLDLLRNGEAHNQVHTSHFYPLSKNRIICVPQLTRSLTLPELETRWKPRPDDDTSHRRRVKTRPPSSRSSFGHGPIAEPDAPAVMQAFHPDTPLPHSRTCLWKMST